MVADLENAKKLLADKSRELDDVQEQLKAGEIVSPVNGIVLARRGEPGQPVGDDGNMELFLNAHPVCSLATIEGNQARITFVSPSPLIKPGMTAQVRITLP